MRIVDKKRDYYDCIQRLGQDLSLNYIRTEKTIHLSDTSEFPFPYLDEYVESFRISHIIGFCGNIYPAIEMRYSATDKSTFCFSAEDIKDFAITHYTEHELTDFENELNKRKKYFWQHESNRCYSFIDYFERCEKTKANYKEWFEKERSPIFVATYKNRNEHYIIYNTILRPYNFMRIFNPQQAFQKIHMFMSNLAEPRTKIPEISNDDLAASKGHDDKYSFRSPPGTKPNRKKK